MIECVLPTVPRVLEQHVYLFTLDDYSPHGLLGGKVIGNHVAQWQYAVDLTYRCLASGLWRLLDRDFLIVSGVNDFRGLCLALSQLNPFQLSQEGELYWLDTLMCGTGDLLKIVSDYRIDGADGLFREGLFEAVDKRFEAFDIPWRKGCLFPVVGSQTISPQNG